MKTLMWILKKLKNWLLPLHRCENNSQEILKWLEAHNPDITEKELEDFKYIQRKAQTFYGNIETFSRF